MYTEADDVALRRRAAAAILVEITRPAPRERPARPARVANHVKR
jgi:hypothetical protein